MSRIVGDVRPRNSVGLHACALLFLALLCCQRLGEEKGAPVVGGAPGALDAPGIACNVAEKSCSLPLSMWAPYADADSHWSADVDIRGMLRLFHPAKVSRAQRGAGARITVSIPTDWPNPVLELYSTDNYHKVGKGNRLDLIGHRYRQVVVNEGLPSETIVANVDVSEPDVLLNPEPLIAKLTGFQGTQITLTMRVYDAVGSATLLRNDMWIHEQAADGALQAEPEPPRFWTLAFFGDPVLHNAATPDAATPYAATPYLGGQRPHADTFVPKSPVHPRGKGPAAGNVRLTVQSPAKLPVGYPMTFTVPFPPGALQDTATLPLRIIGTDKKAWPLTARPIGYWPDPDGSWSVRFAQIALFPPSSAEIENGTHLTLAYNQGGSPLPPPVVRSSVAGNHLLDNGVLLIESGTDPSHLLGSVRWKAGKRTLLEGMRFDSACRTGNVDQLTGSVESRAVLLHPDAEKSAGKVMSAPEFVLQANGIIQLAGTRIGRFTHRSYVRAGSPMVRTELLTTWEVNKPQLTELLLCAQTPKNQDVTAGSIEPATVIHANAAALRVSQTNTGTFTAKGVAAGSPASGTRLAGWIAVSGPWGETQASLPRFWEQPPQSLEFSKGQLTLHLFAGNLASSPDVDSVYAPNAGESKRHDVTFAFSGTAASDAERTARGALADRPPYVMNRGWWSQTGAIAVVDPDWGANHAEIADWIQMKYADAAPDQVYDGPNGWGLRGFGDHRISFGACVGEEATAFWANGYWEVVQGPVHWALAYGNLEWLERAKDAARHLGEVGILRLPVHANQPRDPFDGAITVLQTDHAARSSKCRNEGDFAWSAFQVGQSLALNHWMTGDPESRSAALLNADSLISRGLPGSQVPANGSIEPRTPARPVQTLLRAWELTKENKYRDAARQYLDKCNTTASGTGCDFRRGSHILDNGNYAGVTAGLDAMYALNAYDFYRETGEPSAAQIVIGIADAVYAEAMPAYPSHPETLGDVVFYLGYPHTVTYFPQIAILFYEAYDLTGDDRFLQAARATADRYTEFCATQSAPVCQPWYNFGWLDPYLGGWMKEFPTPPSGVAQGTQFPDPTNLCGCSPHSICADSFPAVGRCKGCESGFLGDGVSCSTNLSLGPGVTASSSSEMAPNSEPWRAIDGNTSGLWAHAGGLSTPDNPVFLSSAQPAEPMPFWELHFPAPQDIDDVIIWNRTDCCPERLDHYFVCVSALPFPPIANIAEYASLPGSTCWQVDHEHHFGDPPDIVHVGKQAQPFSHVRVQLPANTPHLALAEVQVTRCQDDFCPVQ